MRVFRGNVAQAVIFEGMLRATGNVCKAEGGDVEPMFSVEKDNPSTVFFRTLLVNIAKYYRECKLCKFRSDVYYNQNGSSSITECPKCNQKSFYEKVSKIIPDIYKVSVRYDLTNNKGYIRMTREVVDYLTSIVPDSGNILKAMENE